MDYVVAGFGIGAILALIGFALWELFGESEEPGQGWLSRTAIGLMIGALVIWAITGVSLFSSIDDSTGSHLVLLTTLIILVAIAAGTFWYWRADQALLASLPPQKRIQKPRVPKTSATVAVVAPASTGDAELSEWDSWPERGDRSDGDDSSAGTPAADVSFEPEVAAEPAATVEPLATVEPVTVEQPASDSEAVEAVELVVAEEQGAPVVEETTETTDDVAAELAEPPVEGTSEDADVETAQIEIEATEKIEAEPASVELPANVRRIRPRPGEDAPEAGSAIAPAETSPREGKLPDLPPVIEENVVADDTAEAGESEGPVRSESNGVAPASAPVAFESSILADIDVTRIEGKTRYQSPILSDLEQDPDELEGIGLAKWRPEARLTADNDDDPPAPKSRRR